MAHAVRPISAELSTRLALRPASVVSAGDAVFALSALDSAQPRLAVLTDTDSVSVPAEHRPALLAAFHGETSEVQNRTLLLGPLDATNAAALRHHLPWLRPQVLGLQTSVGLGDRLGLATPGQLRALREVGGGGSGTAAHTLAPIPAQQSIREMGRTGRSPQQVLDDAMWGVFGEGWRAGYGADADHLKTTEDIDRCVVAGYTFYTFDPSAFVDNSADSATEDELRARLGELPWEQLADTPSDLARRYLPSAAGARQALDCDGYRIAVDEITLHRAAVKYGRAIAHVSALYAHLRGVAADRAWEVEVSVDETQTPTSHAEHVYWATELTRLGVRWVSLAPRFVGTFEKGVDYQGDLAAFAQDVAVHAAIARALGPYKLSLHSGSDKFSIYATCAEATRGLVHLKTAGTSYLEALRTIGELDPALLREIYAFACTQYAADRASYHVSARLDRAPDPAQVGGDVSPLLEQFDARQILHVTFGSVLTARTAAGAFLFRDRIYTLLRSDPELYAWVLARHFVRHLRPFVAASQHPTG